MLEYARIMTNEAVEVEVGHQTVELVLIFDFMDVRSYCLRRKGHPVMKSVKSVAA